jgi:hypothetical protein
MVWLSQSPDASVARALATSVDGSDWTLSMLDRQRVRWRGATIEVEARGGSQWAGLVTGKVHEHADDRAADEADHSPFRPYVIDAPMLPLRLESCWLAVDLEGRVACFDRDQLGAAPMKRCWGPRPEPTFEGYDPAGLVTSLDGRHAHAHLPARHITFCADAERLVQAFQKQPPESASRRWNIVLHGGRIVASTSASAGDADSVQPSFIEWLHALDLCVGCARSPMRDPRLEGVFLYAHQGRARAAPYDRINEPPSTWTIDHAAARLGVQADSLRRSVLPVLFTAKPRLQPVEYVQCTWSETVPWESESGERHGARRLG